jgi:futalosine hydrolase
MEPVTTSILVCAATPFEARLLVEAGVPTLVTGIGPVSAAIALTRRLAASPVDRILICGIGGAYPGSGLAVGDVAWAGTETFGDLGADSSQGFLTAECLGFHTPSKFELDLFPAGPRVPFVTCSTTTGTAARARELRERTGGAVESMEGAALVQVAREFGLLVGEVRGISNLAGDRDRAAWQIDRAAAAAQEAVRAWL